MENPASNTSEQRMGLDQFREGFELYSRLSLFLPLWLTPPYYELYVLCGWKTELISHQDEAALVSKICFSVQNQLPPSPRDLSATMLISQENLALAQVDFYQHLIRCIRKNCGESENKRHLQPLPLHRCQSLRTSGAAPNSSG